MLRGRPHRRRSGEALDRLADEELLELVAGGDSCAFERVYDRHARAAYSLAYRILGSQATAQDAVQEAFVAAWRMAGGYSRARGSVRTWILAIVHHRAIDAVRRSAVPGRAVAEETGAELEAAERTDAVVEREEDARQVRSALSGLPGDQRRVIELAYFGGFTQAEIAELLTVPLGTVKGRMRLGLEKLRSTLEPTGRVA
jgi:RNA polymerase sigma-70 factor (ECF subfamily)